MSRANHAVESGEAPGVEGEERSDARYRAHGRIGELDPGQATSGPQEGLEPRFQVLEPGFSRNRHFDWYESADGQALRHFRRIIQGLTADLERVDDGQPIQFEIDEETGKVWIELYIPRFRATRRSCLLEHEFEALRSHPRIGPRLVLRA